MGGVRYANIGLAVAFVILIVGIAVFRHAGDGAVQAVGVAAFIAGFATYHGLDERAKRRQGRRNQ